MKNELLRNILWQLNRAYHYDNLLSELPERTYYESNSQYFSIIEMRNSAINDAVKLANSNFGTSICVVRIHQRNISSAKLALSLLIREKCSKDYTQNYA